MAYKLVKVERKETITKLPIGAYYFKTKNGKKIYKNRYLNEFYIVYKDSSGNYVVEYYVGECPC